MADALAEVGVYWLEELLWRTDYRGMAELRKRAKVRIASGEGNATTANCADVSITVRWMSIKLTLPGVPAFCYDPTRMDTSPPRLYFTYPL